MFCRKCGSQVQEGAKFCLKCGNPMSDSASQPAQPVLQAPPQSAAPPQNYAQQPAYNAALFTGGDGMSGKLILGLIAAACVVLGMIIGVVMLLSDSSGDGGSGGGSATLEEAAESAVRYMNEGDTVELLKAALPQDVIDVLCDESGLSEEKLARNYITKNSSYKSVKENIDDYNAEFKAIGYEEDVSETVYKKCRRALSAAGIRSKANEVLYVSITLKGDRRNIPSFTGMAYEVDGQWYFGVSDYVLSLMNLVIDLKSY